jgi:hypothetical protein
MRLVIHSVVILPKYATPTALVFDAIYISIDITCRWHLRDISCLRHLTPMGFLGMYSLIFFYNSDTFYNSYTPTGMNGVIIHCL